MSHQSSVPSSATVHAESIGGIDETTVEFAPGVTALVGPNATNRTSLLQAVAGAIGSDRVTLKGDATEGETTLAVDGETFTRRLKRTNGTVELGGEPYLDDPELADLFAILLEDNEVRRAVRSGDDLRELIMRPVDTEAIRSKIADLVDERQAVDAELDRLETLADELPERRAEKSELRAELDDLEERIAEKRATLREREGEGTDERSAVEDRLEEKLDALQSARAELADVEDELAVERKSLASLRDERDRVADQRESLSAPDDQRLAALDERIESLRGRQRSLESTISELQRVIRFNEDRLDGAGGALFEAAEAESAGSTGGSTAGSVTDELLPDEATTTCWTCGSEVERGRIEETVERLRDLRTERTTERSRVAEEIADLTDEREELSARRDELDRLESRLEELDDDLEDRKATVESLERRRSELSERVTDLEEEVETLQEAQQDELLTLQQQVSELSFERDRLERRLSEVEADIESIESELEAREELLERRDAIAEELADLRTRIDRVEQEAVEAFNTHMASILEELNYENVERIWIETAERTVDEGKSSVAEETFDLHVVRETDSGSAYEDTVDHLSESEREVVGLVVALAGYLVHDVEDLVPFMLLDSLEMIDGERLVDLVSYLDDHVPYLVVVLLPDHTEAFDDDEAPAHRRVTDI